MSNTDCELIAELRSRTDPPTIQPGGGRELLRLCARVPRLPCAADSIPITDVTEAQVAQYLRHAIALFRKRHGRSPGPYWHSIPRSGIHAMLRLAQGQWPPAPKATCAADALRFTICGEYETWLREERGLARPSIDALMWEGTALPGLAARSMRGRQPDGNERRRHRPLHGPARAEADAQIVEGRGGAPSLAIALSAPDAVAPRSTCRRTSSPLCSTPMRGCPRSWSADQIAAVLQVAGKDGTPVGLRDHAILQLLATYGLRSGEIRNLRLEDIDWRAESIRIRHTKTRACSFLPLMEPVGEAVLAYLRAGRPVTDAREIFIRTRAPYRKLGMLANVVRRRLRDAGVEPPGKSGPHIFRHARAVEMLRAAVPQKVIGDLLGHRSTESTAPYLKLATEDLRAIALDVPGPEVLS